jgi:cytochrome bd-type quinol oxidase subunit 1
MVAASLSVFVGLYAILGIVDVALMYRYARITPASPVAGEASSMPEPVRG